MTYDDIIRDGFRCAFGRFYACGQVGLFAYQVERIDGSRLKAMFLPRLTPEANKLLRDHRGFVRGQLQHYGVDFDEKEFSGNGTKLFKKVLQAGKCDKVPDHIKELQSQMHIKWLEQLSGEELSGHPEYIMERYFVDSSGNPDPTNTSELVGIPYPCHSEYRAGKLREAASRVSGLHQATGWGSTQTIYLGWDPVAVKEAAENHGAKEAQANRAKVDGREEERASKHNKYLANAQSTPSPVGQYIIDCEEIENNWPDLAEDMTLAIYTTPTPGIHQASFDFGIIEGMMMLSSDESILDRFCAEQEHDHDSDGEDDDEEDSQDDSAEEKTAVGSKRKVTASSKARVPRGRPPKKAKVAARTSKSRKYFLRLKSRDTGTGEIHLEAEKGTIKFGSPGLSSFTGEANMGYIGRGVVFTARKISAVPPTLRDSWDNYSEAAYESARVGRWR